MATKTPITMPAIAPLDNPLCGFIVVGFIVVVLAVTDEAAEDDMLKDCDIAVDCTSKRVFKSY